MKRRTTPVTGVALRIDVAPFVFWGGWVNKGGKTKKQEEKLHSQTDPDKNNSKKKAEVWRGKQNSPHRR